LFLGFYLTLSCFVGFNQNENNYEKNARQMLKNARVGELGQINLNLTQNFSPLV